MAPGTGVMHLILHIQKASCDADQFEVERKKPPKEPDCVVCSRLFLFHYQHQPRNNVSRNSAGVLVPFSFFFLLLFTPGRFSIQRPSEIRD